MIEIVKIVVMIGLILIMFVVWLYVEAIIKLEEMKKEEKENDIQR